MYYKTAHCGRVWLGQLSPKVLSSPNYSVSPGTREPHFLRFRKWQFVAVRTTLWPKIKETHPPSPLTNADAATTWTCQTLHFNSACEDVIQWAVHSICTLVSFVTLPRTTSDYWWKPEKTQNTTSTHEEWTLVVPQWGEPELRTNTKGLNHMTYENIKNNTLSVK